MKNLFLNTKSELSELSSIVGVNVESILVNAIEPSTVKNVVIFEKKSGYYDFDFYLISDVFKTASENDDKLYLLLAEKNDLIIVEEKYGKYIFTSNGQIVEPKIVKINGIEYETNVKHIQNYINEGLNLTKVQTNDYTVKLKVKFGEVNVSLFELLKQGIFIQIVE